jgi:hypothetical protein
MPVCAAASRNAPGRARKLALSKLAVWVARHGKDRDVDQDSARMIGLKTQADVPMRTVQFAAAESADGRERAVSLVYNSDGNTMKPVAFVLWRLDESASTPAGRSTKGRTFLLKLSGELACAVEITDEPRQVGGPIHSMVQVPFDSPETVAGFREELDFWLAESAKPKDVRVGR